MPQHRDVSLYEAEASAEPEFDKWWSGLTPQEQRVEIIIDLMSQGRWFTGTTPKALAHKWQLSVGRVREIAAEASRQVRRYATDDPADRELMRNTILTTFDVIRHRGLQNGDSGSMRVALEATKAMGFYLGLEPVQQLGIQDGREQFHSMSTDDLRGVVERGKQRRAARRSAEGANGGRRDH